jgi:hypothetical protein
MISTAHPSVVKVDRPADGYAFIRRRSVKSRSGIISNATSMIRCSKRRNIDTSIHFGPMQSKIDAVEWLFEDNLAIYSIVGNSANE